MSFKVSPPINNPSTVLKQYIGKHKEFVSSLQTFENDDGKLYDILDTFTESIQTVENFADKNLYYFKFIKEIIKSVLANLNFYKHLQWIHSDNEFKVVFAITLIDSKSFGYQSQAFIFELGIVTLQEYIRIVLLESPVNPILDYDNHFLNLNTFTKCHSNVIWVEVVKVLLAYDSNSDKETYNQLRLQVYHITKRSFTKYMTETVNRSAGGFGREFVFVMDTVTLETLVKVMLIPGFVDDIPDIEVIVQSIHYALEQGIYSETLLDLVPQVLFNCPHSKELFTLIESKTTKKEILKEKVTELYNFVINETDPLGLKFDNVERLINLLTVIGDRVYEYFSDEKQVASALSLIVDGFIYFLLRLNDHKFNDHLPAAKPLALIRQFQDIWYKSITPKQKDLILSVVKKQKLFESPNTYIIPLIEIGNLDFDIEDLVKTVITNLNGSDGMNDIVNYLLQKKIGDTKLEKLIEVLGKEPFIITLDIKTMDIMMNYNSELYLPIVTEILLCQLYKCVNQETNLFPMGELLGCLDRILVKNPQILSEKRFVTAVHSVLVPKFFYSCIHFEHCDLVLNIFQELFKSSTAKYTLLSASKSLKTCFELNKISRKPSQDPNFVRKYCQFMLRFLQNQFTYFLVASEIREDLFVNLFQNDVKEARVDIDSQFQPVKEIVKIFPELFDKLTEDIIGMALPYGSSFSNSGSTINQFNFIQSLIPTTESAVGLNDAFKSILLKTLDRHLSGVYSILPTNNTIKSHIGYMMDIFQDTLDYKNVIHVILVFPSLTERLLQENSKLKVLNDPETKNLFIKTLEHPLYYNSRDHILSSPKSREYFDLLYPSSPVSTTMENQTTLNHLPDILISKIFKLLILEKDASLHYKVSLSKVSKKIFENVKKIFQQVFEKRESKNNPISHIWLQKTRFFVSNEINRLSPWCLLQNVKLVINYRPHYFYYFGKDYSHLEYVLVDNTFLEIFKMELDSNPSCTWPSIRHISIRINEKYPAFSSIVQRLPNIESFCITMWNEEGPALLKTLSSLLPPNVINKLKFIKFNLERSSAIPTIDEYLLKTLDYSNPDIKIQFTFNNNYFEFITADSRVVSISYTPNTNASSPISQKLSLNFDNLPNLKKLTISDRYASVFASNTLPKLKKLTIVLNDLQNWSNISNISLQSYTSLKVLVFQFKTSLIRGPETESTQKIRNIHLQSKSAFSYNESLNEKFKVPDYTDTTKSTIDYTIYKNFGGFGGFGSANAFSGTSGTGAFGGFGGKTSATPTATISKFSGSSNATPFGTTATTPFGTSSNNNNKSNISTYGTTSSTSVFSASNSKPFTFGSTSSFSATPTSVFGTTATPVQPTSTFGTTSSTSVFSASNNSKPFTFGSTSSLGATPTTSVFKTTTTPAQLSTPNFDKPFVFGGTGPLSNTPVNSVFGNINNNNNNNNFSTTSSYEFTSGPPTDAFNSTEKLKKPVDSTSSDESSEEDLPSGEEDEDEDEDEEEDSSSSDSSETCSPKVPVSRQLTSSSAAYPSANPYSFGSSASFNTGFNKKNEGVFGNTQLINTNSITFLPTILSNIHRNSNVKRLKLHCYNMTFIHMLLPLADSNNIIYTPVTEDQPTQKPIWYVSNDYQTLYRI
ncbi:WD40-like domain-containing protein [Tieghemostelium lacteum]|uniref:WD40-like domain-containing protein n=1 Tax=Tieghemostelium lacteum TaxID=361077 RepID=A0A152A317_TIELA|nr:WD40-like domain-containing protein [Tieghemostelium lacteum]|eukprot:KYR00441.1 WD40-like domain-containing protein [Tieghemostelium lacteum]